MDICHIQTLILQVLDKYSLFSFGEKKIHRFNNSFFSSFMFLNSEGVILEENPSLFK